MERTVKFADPRNPAQDQMAAKYALQRGLPGIQGSCQWYARAVADDKGSYGTRLRTDIHRTPALQPEMPWIDKKAPKKPRKVKPVWTEDGYILFWTAPKGKTPFDEVRQYAVYVFPKGMKVDLNNTNQLIAVTSDTFLKLPYNDGSQKWTYVVTALDRLQNESKGVKKTVKL